MDVRLLANNIRKTIELFAEHHDMDELTKCDVATDALNIRHDDYEQRVFEINSGFGVEPDDTEIEEMADDDQA